MKEILFDQNIIETNLELEKRVILAIEKVDNLTGEIALQMGDQWERDRFGKYKSEHMIKMTNRSEEIINNYELNKDEEAIKYLPLFKFICRSHDLGRHFHDDKRYVDEKGMFLDHGEISIRLMEENKIMNIFSDDEQKIIEYTVRNHSLKEIACPVDEIEKKTQVFCLVFRDMDKLEILNKRDYLKAREIYRLLGLHYNLGEYKEEWKNTEQKENYIDLIQHLLDEKNIKIEPGLGVKIEEIINKPIQEKIGDVDIIADLEDGKSMPLSVYRETKSYANYILFSFSLLGGINYKRTLMEIDQQVIKEKLEFLRSRTNKTQYTRIRSVLESKYNFKID